MTNSHVHWWKNTISSKKNSSLYIHSNIGNWFGKLFFYWSNFRLSKRTWSWWHTILCFLKGCIRINYWAQGGHLYSTFADWACEILLIGTKPMINARPALINEYDTRKDVHKVLQQVCLRFPCRYDIDTCRPFVIKIAFLNYKLIF